MDIGLMTGSVASATSGLVKVPTLGSLYICARDTTRSCLLLNSFTELSAIPFNIGQFLQLAGVQKFRENAVHVWTISGLDWEVSIIRKEEGITMKPCQIQTEAAMGWKLATVGPNTSVDSMNNMARHWLTRLEWAKARPVKAAPAEPGSKTSGFNGFPIRRWP
jgi:hypothetical protein